MDQNTASSTPTILDAVSPPRGYVLSGKIMLTGIVVLFGVVFLILFTHLYVRWYVVRRHNLRRRRNPLTFTAEDHTPSSNAALPRGLDKDVLTSIPIEIFSSEEEEEDEDVAAPECAVCLNVFEEGEKVRALPRCGHRFHVDCIDMWFFSHSTCPLCRTAIEAAAAKLTEEVSETDPDVSESDASSTESAPAGNSDAEVRIEVLPEETGSSTSEEAVKLPGSRRISSIRRFLIGDLRLTRAGEPDLEERGESAA